MAKPKGGARPGAGAKPKEIDWDEIALAAEKQWNQRQLAALAGCTIETLMAGIKRHFGIESSVYLQLKKEIGWGKILSKQYDVALDGNVTMLIWLGKQYLQQMDKNYVEQKVEGSLAANLQLKNLSTEELKTLNTLLKKAEQPKDA